MTAKPKKISSSRFNMWRAIFALAHADNVVTAEEEKFMRDTLQEFDFAEEQRLTLESDITTAQDIGELFAAISNKKDRGDFFTYARMLVWCDGDFDEQEQTILTTLKKSHIQSLDFENMVREVRQAFDEDEQDELKRKMREMYFNLQKDMKETGGMLGAVVRHMWAEKGE